MKRAFFFVAVLMTTAASWLVAMTIPSYRYDELFARSDFVAIAEPLQTTHDTAERSTLRDINPPSPVIGVETEFRAELVLKGHKRDRFILHHYREVPPHLKPNEVIVDGVPLITFDSKKGHTYYLLFLVREPDGRFEPTAGQTFVDGVSIWQLTNANAD
jgi:hypothetical protein